MFDLELATLVSYNPITTTRQTPLDDVARLMHELRIHHLPVVDEHHALVGLISDLDVNRATALLEHDSGAVAVMPRVDDVLTRNVQCIALTDSVEDALRLMLDRRFHSVPVVNDQRLEGIITTTDFLRELSFSRDARVRRAVSRAVERTLLTIAAQATLDEAQVLLATGPIPYLAVIEQQRIVGIVSDRQVRRGRLSERLGEDRRSAHRATTVAARCVQDLVPDALVMIRSDRTLVEAAQVMLEQRIQALTVTDARGIVLGAITEESLLRAALD